MTKIDYPKISSLAAPTEEDIALLDAMSDEQRRQLFYDAIDEGMQGEVIAVEDLNAYKLSIRKRALERIAQKHA